MEFRYPYILAMQEQNRKLYRWLRDSGGLDAFLEMKAREASRMYLAILREGPQPPTLPMEREAEERVRAEMFQFPDDLMMATQEVEPENEDVSSPAKIRLARKAERSESKDPAMLIGLIDEPGMFDPIETWKHFLGEIESLPSFVLKQELILRAKEIIAEKTRTTNAECPVVKVSGPTSTRSKHP